MEVRVPESSAQGGPYVIEVLGEIDIATAHVLEHRLMHAIEAEPRPMLLDLSLCSFIDSAGLRVVLRAHQAVRARPGAPPEFAVVANHPHVLDALRLTALDLTIPIVPSMEAGTALFDGDGTVRAGPRSSADRASDF